MAVGLSVATANSILNALFNQTNFSYANVWVQLHVGDPGAAGTANVATETTRKDATAAFGSPSGGTVASDAILSWTNVAGTEDYTHVSMWTASTAGTFQQSGTITANPVTAGDNFDLPVGDISASFNVAS